MSAFTFADRTEAGQALARALEHYRHAPGALVLALPRGGVPVAYEVARTLALPMDVFVVRKIGHPQHPEYALGAVASGGVRTMNDSLQRVPAHELDAVVERELQELSRRERRYRGERPLPSLAGRTVIVVDDGLATGASMRAAAQAIRAQSPARLVLAVPVGAPDACEALRAHADEVVCPLQPEPFEAVGRWYLDFEQVEDEQVQALMERALQQTEGAQT
ncbi:phosphoribosyltransferase [Melaminivora jejuensis]|uniref:phosphoribosyltransferase n=1 Tax=Melaminivora jejuensis TaxID=1267217 RepID=UPI001ADF8EBF|nr:phosphoribosyltransferase family protein [Melaminivora jejuensis]UHJ66063.1 phosphoribosyltransferase [Melaminivora jejuensis]